MNSTRTPRILTLDASRGGPRARSGPGASGSERALCPALCLLLGLAAAATGCQDGAAARLAQAKAAHRALVLDQEPPSSARYDAVLALLERVPETAPEGVEAQRLSEAITSARRGVRAPLARVPAADAGMAAGAVEKLRACVALAERVSGGDGGLDAAGFEALERCRGEAERIEVATSCHAHLPDGGLLEAGEHGAPSGGEPSH